MMQTVVGSNAWVGQPVTEKLCQSSKWVPVSNQGRIRQQKVGMSSPIPILCLRYSGH